jgi:hypothetical protein
MGLIGARSGSDVDDAARIPNRGLDRTRDPRVRWLQTNVRSRQSDLDLRSNPARPSTSQPVTGCFSTSRLDTSTAALDRKVSLRPRVSSPYRTRVGAKDCRPV